LALRGKCEDLCAKVLEGGSRELVAHRKWCVNT
jgi:hypothetical protein